MRRTFLPFLESRKFAQSLKLKSSSEWEEHRLKKRLPKDIPTHPERTYSELWKGWGDWLGIVTLKEVKFRPFQEARTFVHSLKFRNRDQFTQYCQTKERPKDIPTQPARTYKEAWKGWGDWLGTGTVATWKRDYLSFTEARDYVRSLKLKRFEDWGDYVKSGSKPDSIPAAPWNTYKNEWEGIFDWLGYEGKLWSVSKVKELLRDLIKSRIIFTWDEAVLYSLLLRKGLLNLHNNRHANFFKHLIELARTQEGINTIKDYVNSKNENPPETVDSKGATSDVHEIQTASLQELAAEAENKEPLDYGQVTTVEEILKQTDVLESISVDEEAIQFYLDYSVDELWKCAFKDEKETVSKVKTVGKNGNKYHDTVVDIFLSDYQGSTELKIPPGYSFPFPPTLMQRYVAYKATNIPYYGNFSGTGAGKTLSAILASRILDSKMTVIVCPNDVVEQWKRNIIETFPNSKVVTGKDAFYIQYADKEYQYLVLNYDKFSQVYSPNLILILSKQRVDFVILDEVHFTKIRDEEQVKEKIRDELKDHEGLLEVNEERKNIKKRFGKTLNDDSNYKDFITKLTDLVDSHPLFETNSG